jgi:hypothetical protein
MIPCGPVGALELPERVSGEARELAEQTVSRRGDREQRAEEDDCVDRLALPARIECVTRRAAANVAPKLIALSALRSSLGLVNERR